MQWFTVGKAGESVLVTGAKGKPPTSDYKVSYILQIIAFCWYLFIFDGHFIVALFAVKEKITKIKAYQWNQKNSWEE